MRAIAMMIAVAAAGCAADGGLENNTNGRTNAGTNASPNNRPANNTSGGTTAANNTTGTTTGQNNTSGGTNGANNTTGATNNGANNGGPEWRALVANGDFTGDSSSWNLVVFDGTEASTTFPQAFGSGNLAVAASLDRGFVVDLDTGTTLVIDAQRGTEIETIELGTGDFDDAASAGGVLVAASASNRRIVQYASALGSPIALPSPSPSATAFVRNVVMDGDVIATVWGETAQFPTTPMVVLADIPSAAMIGSGLEISGATRLDTRGNGSFVVGTQRDGLVHVRTQGADWVSESLMPSGPFQRAEIQAVVMATEEKGVALTYSDSFIAYAFDTVAQSATAIDGFALPSPLIGADASRDGAYVYIGDYGIRDQANAPWGVGIVDVDGNLLDHVQTDPALPPVDIVALN